jgi:hypothetical protein
MWIALRRCDCAITIWMILIMPARSTKAQRAPFQNRTFAHRGLFEADQIVSGEFAARVFAPRWRRLRRGAGRSAHEGQGGRCVPRRQSKACAAWTRVWTRIRLKELQAFPLLHTGERILRLRTCSGCSAVGYR